MAFHGNCPQCGSNIPSERYGTGYAICECGWFDVSSRDLAQKQSEKKVIHVLIGASVVMVLMYAHLLSWGSYAVSIPFTKLAQLTGTLSKSGYEELAQACIELNKWDCAKDAYVGVYRKTGDPSGLSSLAHLQSRLNERDAALSSYAAYVKSGGNDGVALLRYAKLLEERGNSEQAIAIYEKSIAARPDILPVQATTAIVRHLIKKGQYEDAYARILAFHESAGNAKGYLNTERLQLEEALGQSRQANAGRNKGQPTKNPRKVGSNFG